MATKGRQGLQLGDRRWLVGLGAEPRLEGLLEAFDLAAGGRVVGSGVLLDDAEAASSASKALRPPGPPERRVVKTMPLSVSVDAGLRACSRRRGMCRARWCR